MPLKTKCKCPQQKDLWASLALFGQKNEGWASIGKGLLLERMQWVPSFLIIAEPIANNGNLMNGVRWTRYNVFQSQLTIPCSIGII